MLPLALAVALGLQQAAPVPGPFESATRSSTALARAESLLAAGRLPEARRHAELLRRARPADPEVAVLLGRIHLAWPVVGRYAAESLFTRAASLAPGDPDPAYWLGRVGIALGGADGEAIARRGLVRAISLDPLYRDAWELWLGLYRGTRERKAMLEALGSDPGDEVVALRRALLLVEQRDDSAAEPLLQSLAAGRPADPEPRALLARLLYEQGRDAEAWDAYDAALRLARHDDAAVLWRQVRSIASPRERAAWTGIAPARREAFLRLFWALRDPDLATPANERVGEQFRRLAEARRFFALLHPASLYHHSSRYRRLMGDGMTIPPDRGLERTVAEAFAAPCIAELPRASDARFAAGLTDVVAGGTGSERTINLEDGLDDRGRVFVRHGPPDHRYVFGLDGETWCYLRPEGVLRVTFLRLGGDQVVRPVREGEAASARRLLATDVPSLEARLRLSFWPAAFRATTDGALTELLLFPDSAWAAGVLVDGQGREAARDSGSGRPLRLVAPPGGYALLLDVRREGRRGAYRGALEMPGYPPEELGISSVLVAAGATAPRRAAMEEAAPPGPRLRAAEPMRFYAEVYGLASEAEAARYQVRYLFEREGGGFLRPARRARTIAFSFQRVQSATPRAVETLVVDPARLPRGRYRLRLEVTDQVRGTSAASAPLSFELR